VVIVLDKGRDSMLKAHPADSSFRAGCGSSRIDAIAWSCPVSLDDKACRVSHACSSSQSASSAAT
jgi:hypothetical protein